MIRIIKLLFSFADIAERAAYRSVLVRTFLLTIFRIAEPAARRYVLRYDGNAIKIPDPMCGEGISGRTEALHLAWLFRVFAIMLSNLMAWRDLGRIDAPAADTQAIRPRIDPNTTTPRNQHMPVRAGPTEAPGRGPALRYGSGRSSPLKGPLDLSIRLREPGSHCSQNGDNACRGIDASGCLNDSQLKFRWTHS